MDPQKEPRADGIPNPNALPEPAEIEPSIPPTRPLVKDTNSTNADLSKQPTLPISTVPPISTLPVNDSSSMLDSASQQASSLPKPLELASTSDPHRSTISPRPEAVQIDEMCPSCLSPNIPLPPGYQKRSKEFRKNEDILIWISCSRCEDWYHWPCVRSRNQGIPSALEEDKGDWKAQVEMIDKWYCPNPLCSGPTSGHVPTLKPHPSRRASSRPKPIVDYNAPSPPLTQSSPDWIPLYQKFEAQGRIVIGGYTEMLGPDVTLQWLLRDGCASGWYDRHNQGEGPWAKPIVVREIQGATPGSGVESLEGKMPRRSLTVADIAELNGRDTKIEVMNVSNQSSSKYPPGREKTGFEEEEKEKGQGGWTLGDWSDHFQKEQEARGGEVFNVISYEVSGTKVGDLITAPKIVRDLDWTTRFWPTSDAKHKPKVQLYCLMSPAGSFTDWHIDFAASSVYYHVMSGQKVFYLIRPTKKNLDAYTRWSSSENQATSYLGDRVKETVWKVTLNAGDTMFIPSGYIHAVYTPVDTLVFGGNFLHSYNIPMQLQLQDIEIATEVPRKFRFPHFNKLCWHVAEHYRRELQARQKIKTSRKMSHSTTNPTPTASNDGGSHLVAEPFTPRLLDNLYCLSVYLMRQVRPRERGSNVESAEPEFPFDKIKDPGAVARELRWRVRRAMGEESEDEAEDYTAVSDKSILKEPSKEKFDGERISSIKPRTQASGTVVAESTLGKRRLSIEAKSVEANLKKQKFEDGGIADVTSKDSTTWDADEITQPIIRSRTVTLPRPGGSMAQPEQALESYRSESQIQTRKRAMPDGEIVVEYSGTTKVVVKTTWAPPNSRKGNGISASSHPNSTHSTQPVNSLSSRPPPTVAPNPTQSSSYLPSLQRPSPVQPVRPPLPAAPVQNLSARRPHQPPHAVQARLPESFPLPPSNSHQQYSLQQGYQQIHPQSQQQRPIYPSQSHQGHAPSHTNRLTNSTQRPPAADLRTLQGGVRPVSLGITQAYPVQTGAPQPPLSSSASFVHLDPHSVLSRPMVGQVSSAQTVPSNPIQFQRQNAPPLTGRPVHPPRQPNTGHSQEGSLPRNTVLNQALVSSSIPPTLAEPTSLPDRSGKPPTHLSLAIGATKNAASTLTKHAGSPTMQGSGLHFSPSTEPVVDKSVPSVLAKSPSTQTRAVKPVSTSGSVSVPITRSAHVQALEVTLPPPKTQIAPKAPQISPSRSQQMTPVMSMSLRNHPAPVIVPSVAAPTNEIPLESESTTKAKPAATPKKVSSPLTKSTPMTTRKRSSGGQQAITPSAQSTTERKVIVTPEVVIALGTTTPAVVTTSSENRRMTRSSREKMIEAEKRGNMASSSPTKPGKASAETSTAMDVDEDDSLSELSEEGE